MVATEQNEGPNEERADTAFADLSEGRAPEALVQISVSTASAIIRHPQDPYLVLVASSAKHDFPVIPGGKIDFADVDEVGRNKAPLRCVQREVTEEIDAEFQNIRYIGAATDPGRDKRDVPFSKIDGSVTSLGRVEQYEGDASEVKFQASYGCPDYIFVGEVDPEAVGETDELKGIQWIDIRQLKPGELSAGHDVIVLLYRDMLEGSSDRIDEVALRDFAKTREKLESQL